MITSSLQMNLLYTNFRLVQANFCFLSVGEFSFGTNEPSAGANELTLGQTKVHTIFHSELQTFATLCCQAMRKFAYMCM